MRIIIQGKQGEGKSMMARILAVTMRNHGIKVSIDADDDGLPAEIPEETSCSREIEMFKRAQIPVSIVTDQLEVQ